MLSWLKRLTDTMQRDSRRRAACRPGARRLQKKAHLAVENLEERMVPATITVNSLADVLNPSACITTLRSALQAANTATSATTIDLNVAGTYKITLPGASQETDNAAGEFAYTATNNLSIVNTSGGRVLIDGGGANRVFDINPGAENTTPFTVGFTGLVIQNGAASPGDGDFGSGGGIRAQGAASVVLSGDALQHNTATADGGGISLESLGNVGIGTLTIQNSTIANNHAGDAGGGVETDGNGLVTINSSYISFNTCVNQGAGVWLDAGTANLNMTADVVNGNVAQFMLAGGIGNAGSGSVTLVSCTIEDNSCGSSLQMISNVPTLVPGTGGGFGDAANTGNLTVTNCLFLDNSAAGDGGGIQEGGPQTTITGTVFEGNVSGGNGGGVFVNGQTVSITDTVFRQNVATSGGGVEDQAVTFTVTTSTFDTNHALSTNGGNGNDAGTGGNGGGLDVGSGATSVGVSNSLFLGNIATGTGTGGAIDDVSGTLTVSASQFTGNSAAGNGGAINDTGSSVNVMQSTFNNNRTFGSGGAISFTSTNPSTIQDDTIVANAAGVNGGGIFNSASSLILQSDTISGNSTGNIGGGVSNFNGGTLTIADTIIYGNSTAFGGRDVFGLTITDRGGNLIGVAPPGFGAGTLVGVNPLLGRLENNGGHYAGAYSDQQIVQTEALLPGSPAIGTGVLSGAPTTDERGFPRPAGGRTNPSIGAYEPQYATSATANQIFVENTYEVLLNRPADSGSAGWVSMLTNGASPSTVVFDIEGSGEYLGDQVTLLFQRYLQRTPASGEIQPFVNLLQHGLTLQQAKVGIIGSDEFFQLHGGTNEGYIEALYEDVLGRGPASSEVAAWEATLGNASRSQVALGFVGSTEYLTDLVMSDYESLLGRPADAGGLNAFENYLQNGGGTDQLLEAQLLGSGEAFAVRT
jgi:hypothetical protein